MQPNTTATFLPDPMPAGNGGSPFRPNPTVPPPPPPIDDPNYIPGPETMPQGDGFFSIGRAGQMQEAASNFGLGNAFGAGRGPGGSAMGGMAALMALRAKMAGRNPMDEMVGPGSGAQGGGMQRPMWGQSAPMMRSGMFGMGGVAALPGGMAGALAALKDKQGQGEMGMGQPSDQLSDLMSRFRPLGMMGRMGR